MSDPYKIDGPAIISFSGGSTSGYMLWRIIQAHGGKLPADVVPVFANTGLEHPKTYDFIQACADNWGVRIRWVEFTGKKTWKEVNHQTAARKGEPFDLLVEEKKYLPNPIARFCTGELKIQTMTRFAGELFGGADFVEAIGLRHDEPQRVAGFKKWTGERDIEFPLYRDKKTRRDIDEFWADHPFRLGIPRMFSNCVGCFLKGAGSLALIEEMEPGSLEWWAQREEKGVHGKEARFTKKRPSYRGLIQMTRDQKNICFPDGEEDSLPCGCTD